MNQTTIASMPFNYSEYPALAKASIRLTSSLSPSELWLRSDLMNYVKEYRKFRDGDVAIAVDDKASYIVSAYGAEYLPLEHVSLAELLTIGEHADFARENGEFDAESYFDNFDNFDNFEV